MSYKNKALGFLLIAITVTTSAAVFSRGDGGFNNGGDRGFNNNGFHDQNNDYNHGYNNGFYYDNQLNDNSGVVVVPDDSSCQTSQVCDLDGYCVTQQNCN